MCIMHIASSTTPTPLLWPLKFLTIWVAPGRVLSPTFSYGHPCLHHLLSSLHCLVFLGSWLRLSTLILCIVLQVIPALLLSWRRLLLSRSLVYCKWCGKFVINRSPWKVIISGGAQFTISSKIGSMLLSAA